MQCDPNTDNGLPCVCIKTYQVVLANIEAGCYLACLVSFFIATWKRKKRIDMRTAVLIFFVCTAFSLHLVFEFWVYFGPNGCRKIAPGTSFFCFAPQGIFFMVFIWVIFKLLVIWRVMVSNTHSMQEKERARLKIIKFVYALFWIVLWIAQRTFEYYTIIQRADTNERVSNAVRYTLLVSNGMELVMELCLYGWLIRVSCILSRFLKSFESTQLQLIPSME